jgi:hypothetical protein
MLIKYINLIIFLGKVDLKPIQIVPTVSTKVDKERPYRRSSFGGFGGV